MRSVTELGWSESRVWNAGLTENLDGSNTILRKCAIVKVSFTYRLLSIILVQ